MPRKNKTYVRIDKIREAIADYMRCEGCSCCRDNDGHDEAKKRIAEMLGVPPFSDGSGYNFGPFETGDFGEPVIVEDLPEGFERK